MTEAYTYRCADGHESYREEIWLDSEHRYQPELEIRCGMTTEFGPCPLRAKLFVEVGV